MQHRRRFKQTKSLQDRLTEFAADARHKASEMAPGPEQDEMLKKARQADTAASIDGWTHSHELQPPR